MKQVNRKVWIGILVCLLLIMSVTSLIESTTRAEASFNATTASSQVSSGYFIFNEVTGGVSVALTSTGKSYTGEIHVPKTYNGKNVVAVANDGFRSSQASAIYFEDSGLITSIGTYAFSSSKATNVINLPNITSVPNTAFSLSNFSQIILNADKITYVATNAFTSTPTFTVKEDKGNITITPQSQVNVWEVKYAKGTQDASYFTSGGTKVSNNTFQVNESGTYTIYLRDGANRVVTKVVELQGVIPGLSGVRVAKYKLEGAHSQDWTTLPIGKPTDIRTFNLKLKKPGTTVVSLYVEDAAGNQNYQIKPFTVKGGKTEAGVAQIEYRLTGALEQGWTAYTKPFTITQEGVTLVDVRITDEAGNVTTTSQTIRLDKTAPVNAKAVITLD